LYTNRMNWYYIFYWQQILANVE